MQTAAENANLRGDCTNLLHRFGLQTLCVYACVYNPLKPQLCQCHAVGSRLTNN